MENISNQTVNLFVQGSKYKNPLMLIDEDGMLVEVQSRPMLQTVVISQPKRSCSSNDSNN